MRVVFDTSSPSIDDHVSPREPGHTLTFFEAPLAPLLALTNNEGGRNGEFEMTTALSNNLSICNSELYILPMLES
jgi:hypothetical protein